VNTRKRQYAKRSAKTRQKSEQKALDNHRNCIQRTVAYVLALQ